MEQNGIGKAVAGDAGGKTAVSSAGSAGFRRVLTLRDLVLFGLAFVGPTAPYSMYGIATVKSQGHLPLVYFLAMIVMSLTALSYGRMASVYQEAGSTYTYASKGLHPTVGFLTGWAMILDYVLIPMLSVIFVGLTAAKLVPELPYWLWAVITVAVITSINVCGIRVTARANLVMNTVMIGSLCWFVVMALRALLSGVGGGSIFSLRPFYHAELFQWNAVLGATSLAALSYLGFDGISTLSEDACRPEKDIGRATLLVCFLAGGLFVLQSYLAQMVWPDFTRFQPVETAFLDVGRQIGGAALFFGISFVLLVGGLASAITGQASASRMLVGMGRDNLLPRRLFAHIHPSLGTPVYSILLMGAIHLAGALILRYTEAAELVNYGALLGFIAVNAAVIRHFYVKQRQKRICMNLILPGTGMGVCFALWIHLSPFALELGSYWLGIGVVYLLVLTRGCRRPLSGLRLE